MTPIASNKLVEINLRAGDEVGQLTTAFNAMIRQLRQSFETLEQRVVERTHELQIAKDAAKLRELGIEPTLPAGIQLESHANEAAS